MECGRSAIRKREIGILIYPVRYLVYLTEYTALMDRIRDIFALLTFFIRRKKVWLVPVVMLLLMSGALFLIVHGIVASPVIYTMF